MEARPRDVAARSSGPLRPGIKAVSNNADRRLKLVRDALEAWATGELDGALAPREHEELGRSLVSIERWLTGTQRTMPTLDVTRAAKRLSNARAQRMLPARCRGAYWWLSALRFYGKA
jgi:hypothetical protein